MKVLKDLAVSGSITVGQLLQSSINTDKFLVSESGVVKYRSGSQILGDIGAAASGHTHTFASLTSKPTTLSGYGITDAALSATTITINGTTYDLSANRSWTITATETDTLASVTARGASTSTSISAANFQNAYQVLSLNNIKTPGLYNYDGGITGTQPLGTEWYNVRTIELGADGRYSQFVMPYNIDRIFYRRKSDAGFAAYVELYHTGNIPTWNQNTTGTAASISGFNNPTAAATANTIAYRDGSGDLYARYFLGGYINTSDNVETGTITYIMAKFGDNYHRSATAAKVQAFLGLGSLAYSSATIPTNNNQLTNGAGYITGSGSISGYAMSLNGYTGQTEYTILTGPANGPVIKIRYDGATANRYIDIGSKDGNGVYSEGLKIYNGGTPTWAGSTIWHQGNLTNLNQLTNGPGYITGYTEVDTLATVTARGSNTTAGINVNGRLTAAGGGTYAVTGSSTQRYIIQALNTSNSVNAAYGWWWFHNTNGDMGFHADAVGDILTLTRGGGATINGNAILTAGSYNSYSPTLTGTGASGTWGINISGTSNNITAYTINQSVGTGNAPTFAGLTINTGGTGTWGPFVVTSTSLWGDGATQYVTIGAGGATGIMIYNPHIVWNAGESIAGVKFGRSGGISSGAYYVIGTGASDNFFITKNGVTASPQLNINSSGNATFSGTLSASNLSGTNTGDQTNISGTAATATNVAWSGVTSKPSNIMYYQSFTLDANTMDSNATGFTYANNAPFYGPIARFSTGGGYDLWLGGTYNGGGNSFYIRTRNGDAGTFNSWRQLITDGNIASQSVSYATTAGNAATAGGLAVHTSTNNEVNKIVRTDANGYIQAGWINSISGNMGFENRIARITCSGDQYMRFQTLTEFKVSLGMSGKNDYSRRIDYTSDANYHVGSFGHGGAEVGNIDRIFHYGSGFFDVWSGNGTYAPGTSHIHGFNALHYTTGYGGTAYGWQMASQYNQTGLLYARWCSGGTFSAWQTIITSANIGSQSVSYASSAGSVAWSNVSSRPTTTSAFTNDNGFITSGSNVVGLYSSGWGNGNFTWYQTPGGLSPYTGSWASFLVSNHGDGSNYYNQTIIMPFWGVPQYSRREGGTNRGPYTFWTTENLDPNSIGGNLSVSGQISSGGLIRVNGNTNLYLDYNYGCSVVGVYSSYRYQGVYSMGDAYKLAIDGTTPGNLYGMSWSHPNAGGQAGYLDSHGLLVMVNGITYSAISNSIWARGDVTAYSDARVKENVEVIENALEKIQSIRGVTFTRNDMTDTTTRHAGVIAQELLKVLPEVITTNKDNGHYSVAYGNMAALFIEAIKEQQLQIEELKNKLDNVLSSR